MPTRDQVRRLLHEGYSYEAAGRELGVPPGQAFMLATGMPADASTTPTPEELAAAPVLPGSSQHLIGTPAFNPTRNEQVDEWVRARAARELRRSSDGGP